MIPAKLRRRFNKAVLQYGLPGAIARSAIWPFLFVGWRVRERMPFERNRRLAGEAYDRQHGVDTTRDRSTEWTAEIKSDNLGEGTGYGVSPPETVRRAIGMLPAIDHDKYVFIDLGSGKGRVILVAAEFPFKECLGVEYAPDLHEVAARNIARFKSDKRRCPVVKSICGDAAVFQLPKTPLVLYLGHPFGGATMDHFLAGLRQSLVTNPRKVFVIYYDPICRDNFIDVGFREIGSYDLPWLNSFHNRVGKEFVVLESDSTSA